MSDRPVLSHKERVILGMLGGAAPLAATKLMAANADPQVILSAVGIGVVGVILVGAVLGALVCYASDTETSRMRIVLTACSAPALFVSAYTQKDNADLRRDMTRLFEQSQKPTPTPTPTSKGTYYDQGSRVQPAAFIRYYPSYDQLVLNVQGVKVQEFCLPRKGVWTEIWSGVTGSGLQPLAQAWVVSDVIDGEAAARLALARFEASGVWSSAAFRTVAANNRNVQLQPLLFRSRDKNKYIVSLARNVGYFGASSLVVELREQNLPAVASTLGDIATMLGMKPEEVSNCPASG